MKIIPLTQGKVTLIDDEDFNAISKFKWFAVRQKSNWYAQTHIYQNGRRVTKALQCLILPDKPSFQRDHINGNGLDNRRVNLRYCTAGENMMNRRKHKTGTSRFKGVRKHRNLWEAQIQVKRKILYLGRYVIEEDAAKAYNTAALKHFGDFASLNVI